MKPARRLSLRTEHLADLAPDELREVLVGTGVTSVFRCQTYEITCWGGCPPTLPIDRCPIENTD